MGGNHDHEHVRDPRPNVRGVDEPVELSRPADEEIPAGCHWDEEHHKVVQDGTDMNLDTHEYMTLDDDGQDEFDRMWLDGDTVTSDGYIEISPSSSPSEGAR